jgi:putative SOS response-associated peptidase YedK
MAMNAQGRPRWTLAANTNGPGKIGQVVIWESGQPRTFDYRWGLRPADLTAKPVSLLRSEGRAIANRCLIVANEFFVNSGEGRAKRYRIEVDGPAPFFCFAGLWQPAREDWPAAYAALTVPANPDIAPFKDRHMGVIREEDWIAWLMGRISVAQALRPLPRGSFRVHAPNHPALGDLFAPQVGSGASAPLEGETESGRPLAELAI